MPLILNDSPQEINQYTCPYCYDKVKGDKRILEHMRFVHEAGADTIEDLKERFEPIGGLPVEIVPDEDA